MIRRTKQCPDKQNREGRKKERLGGVRPQRRKGLNGKIPKPRGEHKDERESGNSQQRGDISCKSGSGYGN